MLLPILIILPFFGGMLCLFFDRYSIKLSQYISIAIMSLIFIILLVILGISNRLLLLNLFQSNSNWNMEYNIPWIPRLGINFYLAVDGFSLVMLLLTSVLGIIAVLCSWNKIKYKVGFFYFNLLWVLGSVIGIFLSLDLFLFFCFWELIIFPIYFLIVIWGYKDNNEKNHFGKTAAANKFFMYSQISGLILLFSILNLVYINYFSNDVLTFNYNLLRNYPINLALEIFVMLGFFLAFAIKIPIFPFHNWLSDFHAYSPVTGSVDLSGILTKTAVYALVRFNISLFPHSSAIFSHILIWIGVVTIFYGAIMSFVQNNVKRLIAYSSISHMGFLIITIYSANPIAYQGLLIQIVAYSLSTSALLILTGTLFSYTKTFEMCKMGGLWSKLNWIPGFSLFFAMANLGIPGTGNFIGEFLIFIGCFSAQPWIIGIVLLSLIISALYSLTMIRKIYYGPLINKCFYSTGINDSESSTLTISIILMSLIILIGIHPNLILNISHLPINNICIIFSNFFN